MTFDTFYQSLTSDEIWTESVSGRHKIETFKEVCFKVFKLALSDPEQFKIIPVAEHRKHVVNVLAKILPDKPKGKPWHVVEAEKIEANQKAELEAKQIITYTKEHADRCAAEALEIIRNSKTINAVPRIGYKQAVEEGGWIPKKDAPYPVTSKEEAYAKDRHLAYIIYAFEPRTGDKRPGVVSEEEFNLSYDIEMLNKEGR